MSRWSIVIPFRGTVHGKSRLATDFVTPDRVALAFAFLQDTMRAVLAVPSVGHIFVITNHPNLEHVFSESIGWTAGTRITVLKDPGCGLNSAVSHGFETAQTSDSDVPVAALAGDLAALQAEDLAAGLEAAAQNSNNGRPLSFVADHQGIGTTMITTSPRTAVRPHFGVGSAAVHLDAGHAHLAVPNESTLRLDIDSFDDLAAAEGLSPGLGPATRATLAAIRARR